MVSCLDFSPHELHGLSIFIAMSSKHFEFVAKEVGFTTNYTPELRTIAREFSEIAFPAIGISTLIEKVEQPSYDAKRLLTAWQNVFTELHMIKRDNDICDWLQKLRVEDTKFSGRMGRPSWDFLLVDWAMDKNDFPVLQLPHNKIQDIKIVAMKRRLLEVEWHFKFPQLKDELEYDEWEAYVMERQHSSTWMIVEIRQQQNISRWVNIFRLLDSNEIEVLDKWGHDIMQEENPHLMHNYFSLVDLAKDLRETGYYNLK